MGKSYILLHMSRGRSGEARPTGKARGTTGRVTRFPAFASPATSEFSPRQITGSFQPQHFQPPASFKAYLAQSCESSANFLPDVSQFPACLPSAIRVIGPVSCFSEPPGQGCHSAYEVGLQEIGPVSARRNQWGHIH
jgi:hypothetical protein